MTKVLVATNIPDAWFQVVYATINTPFICDKHFGHVNLGKRYEIPLVALEVTHPLEKPYLPEISDGVEIPGLITPSDLLDFFLMEFMEEECSPDRAYTYGSRICEDLSPDVHQLDYFCEQIDKNPYSDHTILQIARPVDLGYKDPPALQSIQAKVVNQELHFIIHCVGHNVCDIFLRDLAAIAMLMHFIVSGSELTGGKFFYYCTGLHAYEFQIDLINVAIHDSLVNLPEKTKVNLITS